MNYAELSNEIENETPKHAQTNYQYGVIRYFLLIKSERITFGVLYNSNKCSTIHNESTR